MSVGRFGGFLLSILLIVGCTGETTAGPCDPDTAAPGGDVERSHTVGDVEQPYWLIVPDDYRGELMPLWLQLPGALGDHESAYQGWQPSMSQADALVAVPSLRGEARDAEVISGLIDDIAADYCIDRSRVYAIGGSGSGTFTGMLMTSSSDEIAAFAIGIGGFNLRDKGDAVAPFWAWTGNPDQPTTEPSAISWAEHNGCDPDPTVTDLGEDIAHWHYEGCEAAAEYYFFDGMGHQVPSYECPNASIYCAEYDGFDFVEEVTKFFDAHPLAGVAAG